MGLGNYLTLQKSGIKRVKFLLSSWVLFSDLSQKNLSFFQDPVPSGFSAGDVLIPLADEYDPMFPNDYEKVVKRQREERQRQRELERQKEIEEREK